MSGHLLIHPTRDRLDDDDEQCRHEDFLMRTDRAGMPTEVLCLGCSGRGEILWEES